MGQNRKYENVMLLAMSTLPRNPEINTYQIQEEKETLYFKGISQMEPHTKYVLYHLAEQDERLDRIVILASAKAREEGTEKDWYKKNTAVSFFEKRIRAYLGEPAGENFDEAGDKLEDIKEKRIRADMYETEDCQPQFILVNLENPLFFWEAVQKIRSQERGKTVHLYMDMQGGDRNAVSQMNAIAELLERQGVKIMGRYANDYNPTRRDRPLHTIREVSKEYRTYDLISAMDIFAQYGWGDRLEQYFKGDIDEDSKESRLIGAIKQASSAICQCNAEGFDSAVKQIEKLEAEFENPEKVTEMDVVYQDIHENYASLFGAKYRYVEQIRWCLKKSFLQQALTIFEAKMPYEFICSGLVYYRMGEGGREEYLEKCEEIYNHDYNPDDHSLRKNGYKMKDLNHYLIKDYLKIIKNKGSIEECDEKGLLSFGLSGVGREETLRLIEVYRKLCWLRNQVNHAEQEEHNPEGFFRYMQQKRPDDNNWTNNKNGDIEQRIRVFLGQWKKLADQVPEELRSQSIDLS